jgi:hypothetical protein
LVGGPTPFADQASGRRSLRKKENPRETRDKTEDPHASTACRAATRTNPRGRHKAAPTKERKEEREIREPI